MDDDQAPETPRWVILLLMGLGLAALVLLVTMLLVGGDHGPGRHFG